MLREGVAAINFNSLKNYLLNDSARFAAELGFMRYLDPEGEVLKEQDEEGNTLLHYAVKEKLTHMVARLIREYHVDLNVINLAEETPLVVAIKLHDVRTAKLLIDADANPFLPVGRGNNAVSKMARELATIQNKASDEYRSLYGLLVYVDKRYFAWRKQFPKELQASLQLYRWGHQLPDAGRELQVSFQDPSVLFPGKTEMIDQYNNTITIKGIRLDDAQIDMVKNILESLARLINVKFSFAESVNDAQIVVRMTQDVEYGRALSNINENGLYENGIIYLYDGMFTEQCDSPLSAADRDFFVKNVFMHELLHVLGLADRDTNGYCRESIMCSALPLCEIPNYVVHGGIQRLDFEALMKLYGPSLHFLTTDDFVNIDGVLNYGALPAPNMQTSEYQFGQLLNEQVVIRNHTYYLAPRYIQQLFRSDLGVTIGYAQRDDLNTGHDELNFEVTGAEDPLPLSRDVRLEEDNIEACRPVNNVRSARPTFFNTISKSLFSGLQSGLIFGVMSALFGKFQFFNTKKGRLFSLGTFLCVTKLFNQSQSLGESTLKRLFWSNTLGMENAQGVDLMLLFEKILDTSPLEQNFSGIISSLCFFAAAFLGNKIGQRIGEKIVDKSHDCLHSVLNNLG